MSDGSDPGPDEPLEIDVRSPAEKWASDGRATMRRLRVLVDDGRLDVAALAWVGLILGLTALQIYLAVRASGFGNGLGAVDWWTKLRLLSATGGFVVSFGCIVGVALATVSSGGRAARLALRLAVLGGAWAAVTGILGVAVAFHEPAGLGQLAVGTESKVTGALESFLLGGLGVIVALIAWHLSGIHEPDGPEPPRGDPDLVELS